MTHFRMVRACLRRLDTRNAVMAWEDCVRCLGERFTRQQWQDRFSMSDRCFVRWVKAGRLELGLRLRFEPEPLAFGKTTQALVIGRDELALIAAWGEALTDSFMVRERRNQTRRDLRERVA